MSMRNIIKYVVVALIGFFIFGPIGSIGCIGLAAFLDNRAKKKKNNR